MTIGTNEAWGLGIGALIGGPLGAPIGGMIGGMFDKTDDPPDETAATAQLMAEQYQDWQSTFQPIELNALKQISFNNPTVLPDALQDARETVNAAYDTMPGVLERENKALGLKMNPQQAETSKRVLNLNKALSVAGAENTTRANVRQMDEELLLGAA